MNAEFKYPGAELHLFAEARNWRAYLAGKLQPLFGRRVLEVGAGIGSMTQALCSGREALWLGLEPDEELFLQLQEKIEQRQLPASCRVVNGTLKMLDGAEKDFDNIIYIDVLEHIEDARTELAMAAERLAKNGVVIAVCPAHQWLFSPFDASIGHFRRYNRQTYRDQTPDSLEIIESYYMDSVGLAASIGNKVALRASVPTLGQIKIWDRLMVPLSRIMDKLLFNSIGKSVVAVWRRKDARPDT